MTGTYRDAVRCWALAVAIPLGIILILPHAARAQQTFDRWRLSSDGTIGSEFKGANYQFTRIVGVAVGARGVIYVADASTNDIRVFDSAGVFVRAIGRDGNGPGEFRSLRSIGFVGDTLWAIDAGLRRTSLFSREGRLLSTIANSSPVGGATGFTLQMTAVLGHGRALGVAEAGMRSGASRAREPILMLDRTGSVLDTVAWINASHQIFRVVSPRGATGFVLQPFSDAGLVIPHSEGSTVFVVDRSVATNARNASFQVSAIRWDGDTAWSRRIPYSPVPLARERADSFVTALRRSFLPGGVSAEDIRRQAFTPEFLTPVAGGIAATDGSLWLRRDEHLSTVEYWIVNRTGVVRTLQLPRTNAIMAANDTFAWAVSADNDGVPTITRYRIVQTLHP